MHFMDSKRDIAPDVVRGFALLGILVVNIQYMALSASGVSGEWTKGIANETTAFLVSTFFAGKFYLLFSLMYGYSSSYIIKGEETNRRRWIKRCLFFIYRFSACHHSVAGRHTLLVWVIRFAFDFLLLYLR